MSRLPGFKHSLETREKIRATSLQRNPPSLETRKRISETLKRNFGDGIRYCRLPEYRVWANMKQRCNNPLSAGYENYGGRGVTYCEEWETFENFYLDMGKRPEGTSLDRIDNDGDYEPGNCRWATRSQQQFNRRKHA